MTDFPSEDFPSELDLFDFHAPTVDDYSDAESELTELTNSDSEEVPVPAAKSMDFEEGEIEDNISSVAQLPSNSAPALSPQAMRNRKKRERYRAKRRLRKEAKRRALSVELGLTPEAYIAALDQAQRLQKTILAGIYGCHPNDMHIHILQRDTSVLHILQAREITKNAPLERADIDELAETFLWIHQPGVHLGFIAQTDKEELTLVLAVRIRPWDGFTPATREHMQEMLQVVMDMGELVNPIKNNKASQSSESKPHGHRGRYDKAPKMDPRGVMIGIGWHLAMEAGKSLGAYAPKNKDPEVVAAYNALQPKLRALAALYRDGFCSLFPAGAHAMQEFADGQGVLSFADVFDGNPLRPFANALTATKLQFSNYLHCDNDICPATYGIWWEAGTNPGPRPWNFTEDADHSKTTGGEFVWGAFGIGVDFARSKGVVEIFWRGQLDYHVTLQSQDEVGYTRWGTSIQITKKAVCAMAKLWSAEELKSSGHDVHRLAPKTASRIVTAANRVENAKLEAKPKSKKRKV